MKYFLSLRQQPKAILVMDRICLAFLLVFLGSVTGLIVNFQNTAFVNKQITELHRLSLGV